MNLIEELYALQEAHSYLREEDLRALAARIKVPLYEIEGVASFYPHFRRTPAPRVTVSACRDLVCHMADGGAAIVPSMVEWRTSFRITRSPRSCGRPCGRRPGRVQRTSPG